MTPVSQTSVTESVRPELRLPSSPEGRPRLAGLDGLRGLAVLAVVAYHFDALRGGFLGVDLFFVVSGFLITRMLILRRVGGKQVTLGWFWRRRARRLFPAVVVLVVAVVAVVERLDGGALLDQTRGQGLTGLLYVNNWYDLYANIGYFDVALAKTPLNHLWSLSIGEQFYVVWPLMFMAFARTRRGFSALIAVTAVLMVVSMGLAPFWDARDGYSRAYLGTDTRVGAILLGALLSLVLTKHEVLATKWGASWRWGLRLASGCAAAFLAVQWSVAEVASDSLYRGGLAACSLAAGVLVAGVALDGAVVGSFFGWRPIAWVGRLSYSLYLWHVPIIVLVNENRTGLGGARLFAVQLSLIVATSLASYYLIERPIHLDGLTLNRSFVAAATGVACLAAIIGFPDLVGGSPSSAPGLAAPVRARSFSAAEVQDLTVMVVGDSWGIRTGFAMAQMPDPRPKAVVQLAQPSCGIADPLQEYGQGGRLFKPADSCLAWRTTWSEAMAQEPSFVVMQVGNWDQALQRITPGGDFVSACDSAFKARYNARFDEAIAILTAGGTPVFVPTVVDNEGDLRKRSDCMNSMLRTGVERHESEGVHLLDLQRLLCPDRRCVATIDGRPTYDDTNHIAFETLQSVNRWIFAEVGAVLGTQVPAIELWPNIDTAGPVTVPTTAPPALPQAVEAAAEALGGPGPTGPPAPISSRDVLASVDAVTSSADYAALVQSLAASEASDAFSVSSSAGPVAVAAFAYETDPAADAAAVGLQRILVDADASVTPDDANLKHFDLENTTVSFLRSWQRLVVTVVSGGEAEQRRDLARAAFRQIS